MLQLQSKIDAEFKAEYDRQEGEALQEMYQGQMAGIQLGHDIAA